MTDAGGEPVQGGASLVTGGAGFIGSHVVEALLDRGSHVVALDNFDPFYDIAIKRRTLEEISGHRRAANFEFIEGDICDKELVENLFSAHRFETVVHLAARAGVRPSIQQPALYAQVNVVGTTNLLEAARLHGCRRFALASSSSVYGNNEKTPFSEEDDVSRPISPYAATKRSCELIANTYHHLYSLPIACLRFFTVFGPRQRPDLAISRFLGLIASEQRIPMFGDGSSSRDYTYIDDIVAGVLSACDRVEAHGCRIWNLGGSRPITLADMIEQVAAVVGKRAIVERLPMQAGDVSRTWADLTRSGRELDYAPGTPFTEGLERQWSWMKGRRPS
ncbi:MAG: NAD-dependent epimerase/dehydratase family protein [Phycisphaeraceae bacterium]|nr:MAG: NAD-dependent epimerase/dehydratase family protein [Phycisphaeraceae bacterium]